MRKRIVLFLLVSLIFNSFNTGYFVYGTNTSALSQKKIIAYWKPDVTVELNGVKQMFYDVNGQTVYPIIYDGSTYLPIRAVSALMKEPIEWEGQSKTIFIGKTLTHPNKDFGTIATGSAAAVVDNVGSISRPAVAVVSAYLKPDVQIMYDFAPQTFRDVNGQVVYPIIYNGSAYLSLRAISRLMNEPIEWNKRTKTVSIGDGDDIIEETITEEEAEEESIATKNIRSIFEREESLYYEVSAKMTRIKEAKSLEDKQIIASAISESYLSAQAMTEEVKGLNRLAFSENEFKASNKLMAFVESAEYYILVLENIAYLAATDTDYSMMAETFFYFAMEAQDKMEEARKAIDSL